MGYDTTMLSSDIADLYRYRISKGGEKYLNSRNRVWEILCRMFFQKFIKPGDSVLDIPCGNGEFINHIHCREKIAADIRQDTKKYLRPDVKFIKCDSTNINLPANRVDKIFISNFLEHISREDIIKTVLEAHRVLKEKGQVLILTPNIRLQPRDFWLFYDHITPIDDRALEEVFGMSDFKLIYEIFRFFPNSLKTRLPRSTWLIKMYLKLPIAWLFFGQQSFLVFQKI